MILKVIPKGILFPHPLILIVSIQLNSLKMGMHWIFDVTFEGGTEDVPHDGRILD